MADTRERRGEGYKRETSVREGSKTKSDNSDKKKDYNARIRRHRAKVRALTTLVVFTVAVITVIIVVVYNIRNYSEYTIESSVRRNDNGYALYFDDSEGYIKCSKDGVFAFSSNGKERWNKTYGVDKIAVDRCGRYFAVADIGNKYIYFFDQNGYISTINTMMPVIKVNVSSQGYVAAILDGETANYIDMYDKEGNRMYTIKTTPESDGIPTDIGVSLDGRKLAVAFTSIKGVDIETSVVFYNFGEVGQSESERIVGGFDFYENQLVGDVEFINQNTVIAVAEDVISFFTIKEYPKLIENVEIEYEIEQLFYSASSVGYVYTNDNNEKMLCVYNADAKKKFTKKIDNKYTSFEFTAKGIIMYGDDSFMLISEKGKEKYTDQFETEISQIIPLDRNEDYLFITAEKLQKIKFK